MGNDELIARRGYLMRWLAVLVVVTTAAMLFSCSRNEHGAEPNPPGVNAGPDGKPAPFSEPVRLSSHDGVLEVRLSAHQGTVNLDTVSEPVTNFLVFGYELIKGTSSDGSTQGDNLYPAPTLRVDPGERLIVHYENDLDDLTVEDFYDPAYTRVGSDVPIYPPQLKAAPLNLHTHGLHVSPQGNADNVLLSIPSGMANTYDYRIPDTMPQGLYWYHSHRHTVTAPQTYMGLAGLLEIGRPDGNLPIVTENDIPIRNMAFQYNFVFDRKGSGHQLNNATWPQWVSTLTPPKGTELADGTYEPRLAPVNFTDVSDGAQFMTNWWAGPLSADNRRGQNQTIPPNLQSFTSPTVNVPADPSLPENQRDVQFTINGQFQPELKVKPGQTEIWVLANISDFAYMRVQLTETATGTHPKFAIVGQDGNPYTQVQRPVGGDGTTLDIPPATRYAIAVTMPTEGDLILEMPPMKNLEPITNPGVLYTDNGTEHPPAVLGTVTVDPKYISYADGFFTFPIQKLIHATPDDERGETTTFEPGQNLDAYTSFVDTSVMTADVTRDLVISGGFGNQWASKDDPKAFVYEFADNAFPNIPLIQPRLNSVEEWRITNYNNDGHPMHIHVNDFQVQEIDNPLTGTKSGVQPWGVDNVNVPATSVSSDEGDSPNPSSLALRMEFSEFVGTFVIHCHRLNHEDNGLMALVSVIPEVSTYAVAVPGAEGEPATVQVRNGEGDEVMATVYPFPSFEGTPSVAMADVDGDMVLDLVVGTGPGSAPEVVVYSGDEPSGAFKTELARFAPFDADFDGGISVAGADIDGNALADNIIVGAGAGTDSEVKIFSTSLPDVGSAPEVFSAFAPYPGSRSGVTLATGVVDMASGRESIVTAPGPGEPPEIKTFRYDLYTPTVKARIDASNDHTDHDTGGGPAMTSEFLAYDESYTDGVSLSTGWVAGAEGGAKSVITSQLGGEGTVRVWSTGSRLDGAPEMYVMSPHDHDSPVDFAQIASFAPFPGGKDISVATTSTTVGADLLVSGTTADGKSQVRKYFLDRPDSDATTVAPKLLTTLPPIDGLKGVAPLGGR
ncbi:multicopper oxidase domain-containing protein [Mycobacterium sp. 236(2023)]|uniref:multicopper oxidase family protein n=1 Tax=Mycobacterium sp. 236(2023) TaxID=3038163 RepID=UPI0024155000|nr:multicopper oxidase domain-containing protein [Mycobacterium sp. 236(2023)]MDG4663216.1 multicopper oxidase domain-containing protein [Mycobacterium sp. 236(2023)]